MIKFLQYGLWAVLPVLVFLLAAAVGAILPNGQASVKNADKTIYLVAGPIHYDVLIPITPQTQSNFAFLTDAGTHIDHPKAKWLVVGWGASEFYTQAGRYKDVSARAIWRGITGDDAVLRFDVVGEIALHPNLHAISVTPKQLATLQQEILQDLQSRDHLVGKGLTATDAFYPAKGRFHLFNTCNVWIGKLLSRAELPFGRWTPLPFSVTVSLKWFGHI